RFGARDDIRVARRTRDIFLFVVVAKPDLPQPRWLGATLLELLETCEPQARGTTVGAAGGIDKLLVRQIGNRRAKLHIPDFRPCLRQRVLPHQQQCKHCKSNELAVIRSHAKAPSSMVPGKPTEERRCSSVA